MIYTLAQTIVAILSSIYVVWMLTELWRNAQDGEQKEYTILRNGKRVYRRKSPLLFRFSN